MIRILGLIFILGINSCTTNLEQEDYKRQIHSGNKIVAFIYEESGKQGLIDTNNNVILKAQFDYIQDWIEYGLIAVDSGGKPMRGNDVIGYHFNKYGLIDSKGNILFRPQFDDLVISDNSALVRIDSLFGFVDNKGNWLIKPKYKFATPFSNGAAIVKINKHEFIINKTDELISRIPFDSIWGFKNTISVVEKDGKRGFINTSGVFILPLDNYTGIGDFNWFHGIYYDNQKWNIIDTAGKILPQMFDEIKIISSNDTIYADGVNNNVKVKIKLN